MNKSKAKSFFQDYSMVVFLVLLFVVCGFFVPRFSSPNNLINVSMQIAINALLATGMTFVILTGGIDLSVGSVAALSGILSTAVALNFPEIGVFGCVMIILLSSLIVGVVCGSFIAFNITYLRVPAFIATLAMNNIARGFAYVYTQSRPIFGLPDSFSWMGLKYIGPLPVMVYVMAIVLGIAYIILTRTCFGRYVYAVGSNSEVSKLSGINVTKTKFNVHMICSVLAALGGACLASRLQAGQPAAADGYELNAIAAVAMGGTSMAGGRGGILQTILGLLVIGIINNALNLLKVSSYWQTIIMGVIILVAVISDTRRGDE